MLFLGNIFPGGEGEHLHSSLDDHKKPKKMRSIPTGEMRRTRRAEFGKREGGCGPLSALVISLNGRV